MGQGDEWGKGREGEGEEKRKKAIRDYISPNKPSSWSGICDKFAISKKVDMWKAQ